jgi:hypothetical protein
VAGPRLDNQRRLPSGVRRWPVVAAAAVLIVVGVVVIAVVRVADAPEPVAVTPPSTPITTPTSPLTTTPPSEPVAVQIEHRVLVDGAPVGEPWTTGLARTPDEFVALWGQLGLSGTAPTVDFDDGVVIYFGPAESGCRFGPLDGIAHDPSTGRVFPIVPFEDPSDESEERVCTEGANPYAILVEVDRADLPSTDFVVWVDNAESNVTRIAAGELTASTAPDVSTLRYPEPLPDDAAAFVNDLALGAPTLSEPEGVSGPEPQEGFRQARFVLLDGAEVLARGVIAQVPGAWDSSEYTGAPIDIGLDGAVFVDDEEAAIAYPVDGTPRIVASDSFLRSGSADPAVTPGELAEVARAVGVSDDWNAVELANRGIHVFDELLSSAPVPGTPRRVSVDHGPTLSVVLRRFDQPLSEQQFIAFAANLLATPGSELPDGVELGDTAITLEQGYVELLSPVDVVVVTFNRPSIPAQLDIAPVDELDAAFDGTVDAPPRPAR